MKIRYGIPSYKRPDCRTVDMLIKSGVSPADIYVSLQDEAQLEDYKRKNADVHYIVRTADCAAGNRNTLLRELGAPLILLDDDIRSFAKKKDGNSFAALKNKEEFEPEILLAIEHGKENKCSIIGFSATTNGLVASGRSEYSYDVLLQGSFLVVLDSGVRFDERWKMVEDYEISLRLLCQGKHLLRSNYLSANKPKNGTNTGGLHERYERGELSSWIKRLAGCYPIFRPNKTMTGGCVKWI